MEQAICTVFIGRILGIFRLGTSTSKSFASSETFYGKQLLSLQSFFEGNISITKS